MKTGWGPKIFCALLCANLFLSLTGSPAWARQPAQMMSQPVQPLALLQVTTGRHTLDFPFSSMYSNSGAVKAEDRADTLQSNTTENIPRLLVNWNTFLGGSGGDYGYAILAVDESANIYVGGYSTAAWSCSPASCTVRDHSPGTNNDAFIAKLGSNGALLWNAFLGSNGNDYSEAAAVDSIGNIYITGYSVADWGCSPVPCTVRPYSTTTGSGAFVAKVSSSGELLWNTFLGGSANDYGTTIVVDDSDNIFVAGIS